jgi:hypothetical protein
LERIRCKSNKTNVFLEQIQYQWTDFYQLSRCFNTAEDAHIVFVFWKILENAGKGWLCYWFLTFKWVNGLFFSYGWSDGLYPVTGKVEQVSVGGGWWCLKAKG